jgi:DNA-directed RNA polymerase specialized sigma24 family protein
VEDLVSRVIDGDEAAWHTLWVGVKPMLWGITGKWRITGPLSQNEDDRHNIVTRVMAHLCADDRRCLRAFLASRDGRGSFKMWLATVAARIAIDYVRGHPEYLAPTPREAGAPESSGDRWVRHDAMPDSGPAGDGADVTETTLAEQILERSRDILTEDQLQAMELRLMDVDHDEIARRLGLPDARAADKLLRAAFKRLRDSYPPERAA